MSDDEDITIDFGSLFKKKKPKKDAESEQGKDKAEQKPETEVTQKEEPQKKEAKETRSEEKESSEKESGSQTSEDEEISIDFGKFFRRSENKEKTAPEKKADKEKKKETPQKREDSEKESQEVSIDFKAAGKALYKYRAVILILIPIIIMFYFRSYPVYLPQTDDWAKNSVNNYYRTQIALQVGLQYPNLPEQNKQALIDEQFTQFLKQNKDQMEQQIKQNSQYFKAQFQDENGFTYLADIDSYVWYRQATNIVNNGHIGDELRNGIPYDTHILAPHGGYVALNMYPYVEAYLYKVVHVFNSKFSIMQAAFYTPFFLSIFAIIAAFFIARRVAGDVGGFVAAMLIAIHPFLLSRTFGSDNDIVNAVFPLVILWLFLEAFESKSLKTGLVLSAFAGFFLGLYSLNWVFWYMFDLIVFATLIYLLYYIITNRKDLNTPRKFTKDYEVKRNAAILAVFIVTTVIFVGLFTTWENAIVEPIKGPFSFLSLKQAVKFDLWPNVYTTVAELNPADVNQVIMSIGGKFLFVIALLGIIFSMVRKKMQTMDWLFVSGSALWYLVMMSNKLIFGNAKVYLVLLSIPPIVGIILAMKYKTQIDIKFVMIFFVWFLVSIFSSLSGIRFILLMVPTFCVAVGIAVGIIYLHLSESISRELKINKILVGIVLFILLFAVVFISPGGVLGSVQSTSKGEVPIMNDAWYNGLTKIRLNSNPDAIINSWWDFGHYFKAIADRPVTFDGAFQNVPQAHWIGKVLMTSDEKQAVAILRMLDCGANDAFDSLNGEFNDTSESIDMLYALFNLTESEGENYLRAKHLSEPTIRNVTSNLYCNPPEDFFITSEDMVGKSGVWAHFGSWNFRRAEIWFSVKNGNREDSLRLMQTHLNYSTSEAEKLYSELSVMDEGAGNQWVAPWPSYATGIAGCAKPTNETVLCRFTTQGIEFAFDINSENATVNTPTGTFHPQYVSYIGKNNEFRVKKYNESALNFAVGVVVQDNKYGAFLMQPELAGSIFTRLFYFDGAYMDYFDHFTTERAVTGDKISIWKVDWEGKVQERKIAQEKAANEMSQKLLNLTRTNASNDQ